MTDAERQQRIGAYVERVLADRARCGDRPRSAWGRGYYDAFQAAAAVGPIAGGFDAELLTDKGDTT
jgi:hypothetical protein